MQKITKLPTKQVAVTAVTRHPENARRGDVGAIKDSLEAHGQFVPLVVQQSTGYIIKGNHTHQAMEELGWKRATVAYVDVDDDQALRMLLVDNRSSDLGGYDEDALTSLLEQLNGVLEGTGYDEGDLDARLAALTPEDTQEDSASEDLADWENKDARTIQLTYSVAEHAKVTDALDTLAEKYDLDTYSLVVARLVADATR